jgi:hypothetical protein
MTERVLHRGVALLEVGDPHLLEEIRAVLPLDDFLMGRLSDSEWVVDPKRVKELSDLLKAKGMRPLIRRAPEL